VVVFWPEAGRGKHETTGAQRASYFDTFPAVAVVGEFRLKELRDVGISRGVTMASRFVLSHFLFHSVGTLSEYFKTVVPTYV